MREVLILHASSPFPFDVMDWEDQWGEDPNLWWYRDRTVALLKRYMRLSVEVGRLPSLLGREFFRTRVTSYHVATFEDVVIFVHDVERSLEKLDQFSQTLIAKIVLQEYSAPEAARLLGCSLRHVERYLSQALDRLSEIFLKGELLKPMDDVADEEKSCQEAEIDENLASCCNDGKNIS
jgi:hypothetical protein